MHTGYPICVWYVPYVYGIKYMCGTEHGNVRAAPIMFENLLIIPSSTSQNLYLLFFTVPPIIPKLFCSIHTNTAS